MARLRTKPLDDVGSIVFSRDRALQLDAFLQSVERHAPGLLQNTTVLVRITTGEFKRAYDEVRAAWPNVSWQREDDFRANVLRALGSQPFTVFHTDDDLYFRDVDRFYWDDDLACFTFRLGVNTTYCYPLDIDERLRDPELEEDRVVWRWSAHPPGAYSYPLALNAHVFRTADVRSWVSEIEFDNPNELEERLQGLLDRIPPAMAAFRHSRVVNVPTNLVNRTHPNRNAASHSLEELNERFLAGQRLDVHAMDFSNVRACHQEIDFVFRSR